MLKSSAFIAMLKNIVLNFKTVYMWGVFGAPVTESLIVQKSRQYPAWYTPQKQAYLRGLIGKRYFAFDCVCLIKAILWGWTGDASKNYGGATYQSNDVPDVSANGLLTRLVDVSTDFSNILPGEVVWMEGHVGVYIGDGKVIECTTKWTNNVMTTACLNVKAIAGLYGRTWSKHGKLPWVDYAQEAPPAPVQNGSTYTVVSGDSLWAIAARLLGDGNRFEEIVNLNGLTSTVIHAGQVLKMPTGAETPAPTTRTYTVVAGDSLWAIAAKLLGNGSRNPEIMKLNGMTSTVIHPGQVLRIPLK